MQVNRNFNAQPYKKITQYPTDNHGHAEVYDSFRRGVAGVDLEMKPDQYKFGNFFGSGYTHIELDNRRFGNGAKVVWSNAEQQHATSPYGKPLKRGNYVGLAKEKRERLFQQSNRGAIPELEAAANRAKRAAQRLREVPFHQM